MNTPKTNSRPSAPARLARLAAWIFLAHAAARAEAQHTQPYQEPYEELDRVEGELSFNAVPRRPMALSADQMSLFAVNTHNSTVVVYTDSSGTPSARFHVPKAPVSIAIWDDAQDLEHPHKLVVVCDGTYALVVLDAATGTILDLVELRDPVTTRILGEPADLLVDAAADVAFVSCAAADAVLEVDLAAAAPVRRYQLAAKDPVFMCFDGTPQKNVLVAPMLSGNNSGGRQLPDSVELVNGQHQGPTVLDLAAADVLGDGLPDLDLFRCVRPQGPNPARVDPVGKAMGTVLFALALHPNGKIWQLNTEANNKVATKQTEASIRGDFVQNRLTILVDPGVGQPAATPLAANIKDLDRLSGSTPDPTKTVGQPCSLTFVSVAGLHFGVITGLLTDNLLVLNGNGNFSGERDLPAGSIPRQTVYSPELNTLFVYCWGTSKIEAYQFVTGMPHLYTLDLGYDPTPPDVQVGRAIFYDASNSLHNNVSCASCHVEGRTDMVVWNLSKGPEDDKGPMLTQTLAGIEKMVPFHWRGEQLNGLIDFNPAFVNLLGATDVLTTEEFDAFERFVFSIQNRPNPFEAEERVLDDSIKPPVHPLFAPHVGSASATTGQELFMTNGPGGAGCEVCHQVPLGTNGAHIADGALEGEQNPRRQYFKVGPFHDLYKRHQDADALADYAQTVLITFEDRPSPTPDLASEYSLLGAALSHAGLVNSLNEFVFAFQGLSASQVADVTSFIHQWDQGVAPAVYRAVLLDASNSAEVSFLIDQAEKRNCDLVAFGPDPSGGPPVAARWIYDRASNLFLPDLSTGTARSLSFFTSQPAGTQTFVGLAVGSGRRFGIDFDGDDLFNRDELALGTDPFDPDHDDDEWPDGHETQNSGNPTNPGVGSNDVTPPDITRKVVEMVTGKVARINVETDEPCTVTITYTRDGGAPQTKSTVDALRTHSVLINDLLPAKDYTLSVTATDLGGRQDSDSLPPIHTRTAGTSADIDVIGSLAWNSVTIGGTPGGLRNVTARADFRVDRRNSGPPPVPVEGVRVIARVLVNGEPDDGFTPLGLSQKETEFDFLDESDPPEPVTFTGLSGPFLISPLTPEAGTAALRFERQGLSDGDVVTLNIELVVKEAAGSFDAFTVEGISRWAMPSTPAPFRSLKIQL